MEMDMEKGGTGGNGNGVVEGVSVSPNSESQHAGEGTDGQTRLMPIMVIIIPMRIMMLLRPPLSRAPHIVLRHNNIMWERERNVWKIRRWRRRRRWRRIS